MAVGRVGKGIGSGKAAILLNTGWNDKLLWDFSTEVPAAEVYTNSIASTEKQAFLAGMENDVFSIRAYNSKTGELMWKDLHITDDKKWDSANAIAARNKRVFAAGRVYNGDTGADFTVRAYHARTGELLWEDQYDGSSGGYDHYDQAYAIAISGQRVFAGGKVNNENKEWAFTVRAYHYKTGELTYEKLWMNDDLYNQLKWQWKNRHPTSPYVFCHMNPKSKLYGNPFVARWKMLKNLCKQV